MVTPARLRDLFQPGQPRPVVVFDLDGTLIEDEANYDVACYQSIATLAGIPYQQAAAMAREAYHLTGNGIKGLVGTLPGWTEEKAELCSHLASTAYLDVLEQHLFPQDETNQSLALLATRTSALCVLTANKRNHAERVLHVATLRPRFHPDLVLGRDCTQGHSKLVVDSYRILRGRIDQALPDIDTAAPRIMVEDSASNLPAAKQDGLFTVHMGSKPVNGHAAAIDYKFGRLRDVLDEMNGGRA